MLDKESTPIRVKPDMSVNDIEIAFYLKIAAHKFPSFTIRGEISPEAQEKIDELNDLASELVKDKRLLNELQQSPKVPVTHETDVKKIVEVAKDAMFFRVAIQFDIREPPPVSQAVKNKAKEMELLCDAAIERLTTPKNRVTVTLEDTEESLNYKFYLCIARGLPPDIHIVEAPIGIHEVVNRLTEESHVFKNDEDAFHAYRYELQKNYYLPIGTLASRADRAWDDLNSGNSDEIKERALLFLIDVFDISPPASDKANKSDSDIYMQLGNLMAQRQALKKSNPNFLPGYSDGIDYDEERLLVTKTATKQLDDLKRVDYLTASRRAVFRLDIRQGKFYQYGKVYDSSKEFSHMKSGFVSYTLNRQGEISVFPHFQVLKDFEGKSLAHSAMNAGVSLVSAGELEIKDGKLLTITTHSGHYKPSMYHLLQTLRFLQSKGIDISDTMIATCEPIFSEGSNYTPSKPIEDPSDEDVLYKTPAKEVYEYLSKTMMNNIKSIKLESGLDAQVKRMHRNFLKSASKIMRLDSNATQKLQALLDLANNTIDALNKMKPEISAGVEEYKKQLNALRGGDHGDKESLSKR